MFGSLSFTKILWTAVLLLIVTNFVLYAISFYKMFTAEPFVWKLDPNNKPTKEYTKEGLAVTDYFGSNYGYIYASGAVQLVSAVVVAILVYK